MPASISNPLTDKSPEIPDELVGRYMDYVTEVIRRRNSSRVPIAIAMTIADEHMRTGTAVFTFDQLAGRAFCTPRNARRTVYRLIDAGFLRIIGTHQNGGNSYEPNLDSGLEVANAA